MNDQSADDTPLPCGSPPLLLPGKHPDRRRGDFVRLCVSDTGAGISAEVLEQLFEPFFSTKGLGRGTGLGLAMAASIAKDHGGWLECHSGAGAGTRFDLFLPRLPAPSSEQAVKPAALPATILLVDNHEVVHGSGTAILERNGYSVRVCAGGESALELIQRQHAGVNLVLLDWAPSDPNAEAFLTALRLIAPALPVLLCVAGPTGPANRAAAKCGVAGFVTKPFRTEELTRAVQAALQPRATRSPRHKALESATPAISASR